MKKTNFFYSASNKLYISRKPLKLDSRVKKAADKARIFLQWDDEGRINFIDFDNARRLLAMLGSSMLSPREYWLALEDAKKENDIDMVNELTSSLYCEWLDRIYMKDNTYVDHPKIRGHYKYGGKRLRSAIPFGRPGWFDPEKNLHKQSGMPLLVSLFRKKYASSWKYWSPDFSVTQLSALAPIRGYVTSVGKPSFDLGIPVDARQPVQMIRECRVSPLEPPLPQYIIDEGINIIGEYSKEDKDVNRCLDFITKYGKFFRHSKQNLIYQMRERFFDLLGAIKLEAMIKGNSYSISHITEVALNFSGNKKAATFSGFMLFIKSSRKRLRLALSGKKNIVFVMGHKNPDTDAVISSLFEAWRNYILDDETEYIPVLQGKKMPPEIEALLGREITSAMLTTDDKLYHDSKVSGLTRWISIDQNREPEVQKYFVSIIDHHAVSNVAASQDIPKTFEVIGSSSALVVQKMLGMGLELDKPTSYILHGATLMDTENRVNHKMTRKDKIIMDYLKKISGANEGILYENLMSHLLNCNDPEILFRRDYKEDWGFGFAVAKIKGGFSEIGDVIKKDLFIKMILLARENNTNKNLPLTLLRITDYQEDNRTVNRERIYTILNKESSKKFRKAIEKALLSILRFEYGSIHIKKGKEYIEFWGTGTQLSRKKTAPILAPIVQAFDYFFYSPSTKLYIQRDFLNKTSLVMKTGKEKGLKISADSANRINYISYPEAKILGEGLGYKMLSLKEYWLALTDAKKMNDLQMVNSLQGSNFVEFLDSAILNKNSYIEHPQLKLEKGRYNVLGRAKKVDVPKDSPGLIHPAFIDSKTGIPKKVLPPNNYGKPDLWRYWAPDADIVIPVRSYIFLLKQPCWDGKVHIDDSFPNLGIRPCYVIPHYPKLKIYIRSGRLIVKIESEGDTVKYSWKRGEQSSEAFSEQH